MSAVRRRKPVNATVPSMHHPPFGPPWAPNWIDHRSSRANVHRRIDRGDTPPTCTGCGCETDLNPTPHSPRCQVPA